MSAFAIEGWITEVIRTSDATASTTTPIPLFSSFAESHSPTGSPGSGSRRRRLSADLVSPSPPPKRRGIERTTRAQTPNRPAAQRGRVRGRGPLGDCTSTGRQQQQQREPLGHRSPNILPAAAAMSSGLDGMRRKSPRRKPTREGLPPPAAPTASAAATGAARTTSPRRPTDLVGDEETQTPDWEGKDNNEGEGEGEATPRGKALMPLRQMPGRGDRATISSGSPTRAARGTASNLYTTKTTKTTTTTTGAAMDPPGASSWAGRLASDPSPFTPRSDLPPSASASNRSSSAVSASASTSPFSKRSRSPAKTAADLRFANVEMRSFHGAADTLPADPDIRGLLDDVSATAAGFQVVPRALRDRVAAAASFIDRVWDQNVADAYPLADDEALRELEQVQQLVAAASDCQVECQSEVVWNARVHDRLLQLGLPSKHRVRPWIISTATIIPSLVPRNAITGDFFSSRLVDFCIAVELDSAHTQSIKRLLSSEPEPLRSLNQTMYQPLRFRPVAVAVETKLETAAETGANQLAIWTKAWLNRLKAFAPARQTPPLPLLRVVGHSWFLLLAWEEEFTLDDGGFNQDKGGKEDDEEEEQRREPTLVIAGDIPLGDTRSVVGAYKVLAAIRRLGAWADGPFRTWYEENVIEEACRRRSAQ